MLYEMMIRKAHLDRIVPMLASRQMKTKAISDGDRDTTAASLYHARQSLASVNRWLARQA